MKVKKLSYIDGIGGIRIYGKRIQDDMSSRFLEFDARVPNGMSKIIDGFMNLEISVEPESEFTPNEIKSQTNNTWSGGFECVGLDEVVLSSWVVGRPAFLDDSDMDIFAVFRANNFPIMNTSLETNIANGNFLCLALVCGNKTRW